MSSVRSIGVIVITHAIDTFALTVGATATMLRRLTMPHSLIIMAVDRASDLVSEADILADTMVVITADTSGATTENWRSKKPAEVRAF
jgi:hypothetical protein